MTTQTHTDLSNELWAIADTLRGQFKQSEYGRVILPFAVLRRLECVMHPHIETIRTITTELEGKPQALLSSRISNQTELPFYNTAGFSLATLGADSTADNLNDYIAGFSDNIKPIFEHFKFNEWIADLDSKGLLLSVIDHFKSKDLSPQTISNYEMGLIFEHLIRKFAESANETAGEHYTPRDIVHLTTKLVMAPDAEALTQDGVIRSVYDGAAGSGGFLSMAEEMAKELNPTIDLTLHGQELNRESYAIGMADMLILGQDLSRYQLGNTLSDDKFGDRTFNYGLTNPPFGVNWGSSKKVKAAVQDEAARGHAGRFGAGVPTIRDGSMLFLQNMIAKMAPPENGGGRIGIILSGSPLFNGGAGSGESDIRRWILENDYLEAIVALPTDLFYNTGIGTYIWILSNRKDARRKGLVQLIDATELHSPMRKSLGSKRQRINDEDIQKISDLHAAFIEQNEHPKSKIFKTTDFGYRRLYIQRPLRLRFEITQENLDAYAAIKSAINVEDIAELEGQSFETFEELAKAANITKPAAAARRRIYKHLGVRDDDASIVWKNKKKGIPEIDTSLNETENVPLNESVKEYFAREVLPHLPDAMIDTKKTDPQDEQIGVVGYEINFNRYFYEYQAPRPLEEIDADLRAVEAEIAALLAEVVR